MSFFENNLRFQIVFPVTLVMTVIVLVMMLVIPVLVQKNVNQRALTSAITSLEQLKILRVYYTEHVVKKVQQKGELKAGLDHQNNPDKIPLPATLIHDLSKLFGKSSSQYSIYSALPFPNREHRHLDEFQKFAWQSLQKKPNEIIQKKSIVNNRVLLRVAISDRMHVQACVDCHNTHPLTPKNDWQLGDVRGVFEARLDITEQLAIADVLSTWIVSSVVIASLVLITIFYFLTRRVTKQVSIISNAMVRLGQGDYSTEVIQHSGIKEVDQMTIAFQLFKETLLERQKLAQQNQLFETEKITALGTMVSGIAHEVNTPLGISVTAASYLKDQLECIDNKVKLGKLSKSELQSFLSNNHDSVTILCKNLSSAADLISSFKQVSVDQISEEPRSIILSEYVQEVISSLKPRIRKANVKVNIQSTNDHRCLIYPGALSQVITNLVINSIVHGFVKNNGGIISIITNAQQTGEITICYSDDGIGIDEKIINKVMEPFFTTKRGEGGSGLGLSIIHSIITLKCNGTIKLASVVNQGTIFDIQFNSLREK